MKSSRRDLIKGAGLAVLGGGFLARLDRVAAMQKPASLTHTLKSQTSGASEALFLGPTPGEEGPPAPADFDRLPLEWNKRTVARLKKRLAEREIQAFLVRQPLNIIYLTGYWHTTTERPQAARGLLDFWLPKYCTQPGVGAGPCANGLFCGLQ